MDKVVRRSRFFICCGISFVLQVSRLCFVYRQTSGAVTYVQEGGTVRLICPLSPPDTNGRTVWNGPPSLQTFSSNAMKNPNLSRGERVTVVRNEETGGYDIVITGLTRQEDEGRYSCNVNTNPPKEHLMHLKLYVPPSSIMIDSYNEDGTLRVNGTEGSSLTLTCQSSGGDPPANVSWHKGSTLLSTGNSTATYRFIPTTDDDLQNFTCTSNSPALLQPLRKNVQIFLHLRPGIPVIPKIPDTKEGNQMTVTCSSSGGRPPASLWWMFRGKYLQSIYTSSMIDPSTQTYTVNVTTNIIFSKEDNGENITCMANNSVLPSGLQSSQQITVLYLPNVKVFKLHDGPTVNETAPISVSCSADSSCLTNMSIRNQKTNEILSRDSFTNTLNFTEESARCFHTAVYICTAQNMIGDATSDPLQILVNCGPRSLDGVYFLRITASLNDKLEISADYLAYPTPSFAWSFRKKSTSPEVPLSREFLRTNTSKNTSTFSVRLKKAVLEEDQFGYYTVRVSNDYGSFMSTFYVIPKGIPKSQQNESIACSTELSAIIPVLASISTVMFIVCAGLVTFIIFRRKCDKRDICCFQRFENEGYVMQNVTKIDEHQYQDIGADQKKIESSGKHIKSTKESMANTGNRNIYDFVVENKEDEYLNIL